MTKYASSLRSQIELKVKQQQKFSAIQICSYSLQMIDALDFLHRHSIIHRDLKSDNIFVTLNHDKEIHDVAIGDFDSAKKVTGKSQAKTTIG
jgi:serine/threonine protein kinase